MQRPRAGVAFTGTQYGPFHLGERRFELITAEPMSASEILLATFELPFRFPGLTRHYGQGLGGDVLTKLDFVELP